MELKKGMILSLVVGVIIFAFALIVYNLTQPESNIPVNGEVIPKFEEKKFYLGERIYVVYTDGFYNHFFFHGFDGYGSVINPKFLLIGHQTGSDDGAANMRRIMPCESFTLIDRTFKILDNGHDWITLEWEID